MDKFKLETKKGVFNATRDSQSSEWHVEFEFCNGVKGEFTTPRWADTRLMQHLSNLQRNIVG